MPKLRVFPSTKVKIHVHESTTKLFYLQNYCRDLHKLPRHFDRLNAHPYFKGELSKGSHGACTHTVTLLPKSTSHALLADDRGSHTASNMRCVINLLKVVDWKVHRVRYFHVSNMSLRLPIPLLYVLVFLEDESTELSSG